MQRKKSDKESFKLGNIEFIRDENIISIKNDNEEEETNELIDLLANEYEVKVDDINKLVNEIKVLVSKCNPLELLAYSYNNFIKSSMGVSVESELSRDQVYASREIEYIQSVLVSSVNKYDEKDTNTDYEEVFELISKKINKLFDLSSSYLVYKTAYLKNKENIELDIKQEQFLMECQMSMFVRGDRYQIYEIPRLEELLLPHDDEFIKIYNMTVKEFIVGIDNIQKSLTRIGGNFISQIDEMMKNFNNFVNNQCEAESDDIDDLMKMFHEYINNDSELSECRNNIYKDILGYDRFDIGCITNWPREFMEDLSFEIGESTNFYKNEKYPGWTLIELPVFERPFIKINNKFYCFEYYTLFDNIYRVIQKTIKRRDNEYSQIWAKRQMDVTENIVANLFEKLLPGCTVLMSNYYPKNKSLKQCAENDLLIIYDGNLIIAEVKAGSYTYRAPILDIQSHISSLKTLVEKADGQAERTLKYLKSEDTVKLYNQNKIEKYSLSLSDFNEVTLMCITLDNFNEFAAKIEKLNFLNLNKNTIAISIDDLRIYSDYFDSPLVFLHYLKQRKLATQNKSLYLNDELDHLGLYIKHNIYADMFDSEDLNQIVTLGYRDELDAYFCGLVNGFSLIEKPEIYMPRMFGDIINAIENSQLRDRDKTSTFLLNFSSQAKDELVENLDRVLSRQKEIGRMVVLSLFGETPLSVYCIQDGVDRMSEESIRDYTLSTMIKTDEDFRVELVLSYKQEKIIDDISFKFYTREDVPTDRREYLDKLGEEYCESRIMSYKKQLGKKIGRNSSCPCGSGKKYKKCHGRR